ncbi:hypothetical protein CJF30_00010514 [Rutstroemia sp. NJR-2017a BBW]|nr:hypothetical protein CJF30_00010514 [Rutstroemia sp. NJR-2017a BBW]
MKFTRIFLCFLATIGLRIDAASADDYDRHGHGDNTQADASKQVDKWQKEYLDYVHDTLKTHQSGLVTFPRLRSTEVSLMYGQGSNVSSITKRSKPPRSSKQAVPGARSRFDDFSSQHIILTPYVHFSVRSIPVPLLSQQINLTVPQGLFFHFHRYLLYIYEKALREECGYSGTQPYWDWTISWEDPRKSTVFDGSPTSIGSNGAAIPHNATTISAFGLTFPVPAATGGGCISGPFSDYTVNLGPVAFAPYGPDGGLGYNPRCLSRDISLVWANNTKPTDVVRLVNGCTDLGCFDTACEAIDGVHGGGHFTMGGLGLDAYSSPGDPAFWLHHAMVDRVWSLWQGLDPKNRVGMVYGTGTAFNVPPSPNVTVDTVIDYGVLAPPQKVGDLGSTISGPFCYTYV